MKARAHRYLFLGPLVLILGGCFTVHRDYPEKRYFVFDVSHNPSPSRKQVTDVIQIHRFRVSPRYEGKGFVYRKGELRYETDYYNEFLVSPAALLSEEVRKSLAASGLFRQVVGWGSLLDSAYIIEGNVSELYGDFRLGEKPKAVLGLNIFLLRQTDTNSVPMFERSYSKTVELDRRSPESLVEGWNEALRQLLAELQGDLGRLNF